MKSSLFLLLTLFAQLLSAQTFIETPPPLIFQGVSESSIAFADVDGDSDLDVLIAGNRCDSNNPKLYSNDGNGHFSEVLGTPFEWEMYGNGSVTFADVDGDEDQDVIIATYTFTFFPPHTGRVSIYINDGSGNFSVLPKTPFESVYRSSFAVADVEGDGDLDIFLTGVAVNSEAAISNLYINDGSGNFTEITGMPFEAVADGSLAVADMEGDGDQDFLIAGISVESDSLISKLYTNDGFGNFNEVTGTAFMGVSQGSVAFADIDGDEDQDVLITGSGISILYVNEGSENFSEVLETPFEGVNYSSIAFADVDGDQDQDVLITGSYPISNYAISKLYLNEGNYNFSDASENLLDGVLGGSIAFADVDGDEDQDVLITGSGTSKLYTNDGSGIFSGEPELPIKALYNVSLAIGDVNGDNFQDILISGVYEFSSSISELYTNDGNGNFSAVAGTPFEGVQNGSIAFADVEGDGDQDVLISGYNAPGLGSINVSKLYTNEGNGNFSEVFDTPFEGVDDGSIAFTDVDGDGDQDLLITGESNSWVPVSILYENDGNGSFSEVTGTPFEGVYYSSIAFADVDGDEDQDVLITGWNSIQQSLSRLYTNNGSGYFTEVPDTPFESVFNSSIAFADVDGDEDQDVLITGKSSTGIPISKLYKNDGYGNFSEVTGTPFEGIQNGSIAFADVDGDEDQDLLITGIADSAFNVFSKLYKNDGDGNFSEVADTPFEGVSGGDIAFTDVDGDNDQDLFLTGYACMEVSKLYINETLINSTSKPAAENNSLASIYPNPNSGENIFIDYSSKREGEIHITINNTNGKIIRKLNLHVTEGLNKIQVKRPVVPAGVYYIRMNDGIFLSTIKFIIQ